jgi:GPH family glycoside/pentoside/hexuronide:cation symporter
LFVSTLFLLVFAIYPPEAIRLIFVSQVLHGFSYGITIPLLWAMIADVADYSEWKNNRRATAIIFSAMILGLKFGLAVGGGLVAKLLAIYGYVRGAPEQTAQVANGIKLAISVYAAIPFLICCVLLFWYEIHKAMESRIEQDLGQRRTVAA